LTAYLHARLHTQPTHSFIQHESGDKIICPNGDEECARNLVQLCVGRHTPPDRNYDWFYKFLTCSWDSGPHVTSQALLNACMDKVRALSGHMRGCRDEQWVAAIIV
jgi:hypothetical protein